MVTSLAEMIGRFHQPGRVEWIGVRPARRTAVESVSDVLVDEAGLTGDHARRGKRAVTLLQAEHLPAIARYLGKSAIKPEDLRRNLVISGINLSSLKHRDIQIGTARLFVEGICAPCSRMEETFGPGGYAAIRGYGGWYARVVSGGRIALHDRVLPVQDV